MFFIAISPVTWLCQPILSLVCYLSVIQLNKYSYARKAIKYVPVWPQYHSVLKPHSFKTFFPPLSITERVLHYFRDFSWFCALIFLHLEKLSSTLIYLYIQLIFSSSVNFSSVSYNTHAPIIGSSPVVFTHPAFLATTSIVHTAYPAGTSTKGQCQRGTQ